jgi:hypothetical protein
MDLMENCFLTWTAILEEETAKEKKDGKKS